MLSTKSFGCRCFLAIVPHLLGIALALLVVVGCSSNDGGDQSSSKSQPLEQLDPASAQLYPAQKEAKARDFEVTLMNGESFSLSEHRGNVIVLNIWATWCAPCLEEIPDFVDLYEKYRGDGLTVLGVSIDKRGEAAVKPFVDKVWRLAIPSSLTAVQ
ncbi:MAG: TlpA disulfide reductase family protein [Fodinibius sp.]|nr:TlpA disulfide reductase family protein [Fodinibius sp.]